MITDNKGFSMVELLAVVAILGILSTIGITAVSNILEKAHEEYYINQEKNLVLAAQSFMRSNQKRLPKVVGKKEKVTAKELREANYLKKDITRYDGKTKCKDDKTYVNVYKYGISDYSYTAYLTCPDDKIASEEEKKEKPKIEAVFPGSKDDVATASITITFNGEENNPDTKLLSYSYSVFVIEDGKNVELLNTGTMQVRQPKVEKTVKLSKYAINSTEVILKVKATATNIKGNSTSQIFSNDYKDKTPPTCEYIDKEDDPKGLFRRKTWVNHDVKVTVRCKDGNGSGCEKDTYTKTFTSNGGVDYIKMADNVGNKYNCPIVKFIDKSAPTVTVKAYKCNSSGKATGTELKSVTASGNTQTINSSDLTGNVDGWLNNDNYPHGVCFTFDVEDGSALKSTSWKWNKDGFKKNASGYTTLDGGSINETFTTDDGYNLTTSKSYTHSLSEEGHRYASFVVEDGIGNQSIVNVNMLIDRTSPSCGTATGASSSWTKNNREIKQACTDSISECEKSSYDTTYTATTKTSSVSIKDKAGNTNSCSYNVYVDKTAPTITVTAYKRTSDGDKTGNSVGSANTSGTLNSYSNSVNGWLNKANYPDGVYYGLTVTDNDSGIKKKTWSWNKYGYAANASGYTTLNGQDSPSVDTLSSYPSSKTYIHSLSADGHRYATVVVEDGAGNSSTVTVEAKIDKAAPSISVTAKNKWNYTLTATATDNISLIDKVKWGGSEYSDIANTSSHTYGISGITDDGDRHVYAKDVAGNETDKTTPAYKLFDRLQTNQKSKAYKVGDTEDYECKKDADYNDDTKNHPWKRYYFNYWVCKCTYDYYRGDYKEYKDKEERTGGPGQHSERIVLFYNNSDNGVDACKGDKPKNTYIHDVCYEGEYPIDSPAASFHGYRWYHGAKPADESYDSWHKKGWYHDNQEKDNRVPYDSSAEDACKHSCKIAGKHGVYAHSD